MTFLNTYVSILTRSSNAWTSTFSNTSILNMTLFHWEMSCDEWNQARVEILSDQYHTPDAKEYLIDYFYTKVDGDCEPWSIGRK